MRYRKEIVIVSCVVLVCITAIVCALILQGEPASNFRYETVSKSWFGVSKQQVYRIDLRTGKAMLVVDPAPEPERPEKAKPEPKSPLDLLQLK